MIIQYGVHPINKENIGIKAFYAIWREYHLESQSLTSNSDFGIHNRTFDVEGRAVNVLSLPSFAYIKICGKDKDEIEQIRDKIQEILTQEDERMVLELV